jgi:hypothetical protein
MIEAIPRFTISGIAVYFAARLKSGAAGRFASAFGHKEPMRGYFIGSDTQE